jgi:hypothetical protein
VVRNTAVLKEKMANEIISLRGKSLFVVPTIKWRKMGLASWLSNLLIHPELQFPQTTRALRSSLSDVHDLTFNVSLLRDDIHRFWDSKFCLSSLSKDALL